MSKNFELSVFHVHMTLFAGKMDAVVKYNIIKILKNYEPLTIEETADGFNVNLREPSSATRLKHPEVATRIESWRLKFYRNS